MIKICAEHAPMGDKAGMSLSQRNVCCNPDIAHRDLKLAIEEGIAPLKPASRKKVNKALRSIDDGLNAATQFYPVSTTIFDIGGYPEGAVSHLHIIDDGMSARRERQERIRRGEIREGDWRPRNL